MEIRLPLLWFLPNIKYQHDIKNDFFVLHIHILLYVYIYIYMSFGSFSTGFLELKLRGIEKNFTRQ